MMTYYCRKKASSIQAVFIASVVFAFAANAIENACFAEWKKHTVYQGNHCNTAVAADFTGDGKVDIILNAGGQTILVVAPEWKSVVLEKERGISAIHSEVLDVDGDGDLDFVGARYRPGLIYWLEQPKNGAAQAWKYHVVDERVIGIHGLLVGDVNGDKVPDLLANSAQPDGPFANSLVWYSRSRTTTGVKLNRHVLAKGDAPGLSHYLGIGDVNGDGLADVASAAKGGPTDKTKMGNWFAWWESGKDPTRPFKKHLISDQQPGATNIHPVDVNRDGKTDLLASRGHGKGVIWFENPSWKEHIIHPTLEGPHCLVAVDLDGDGDVDAATCAKDDKKAVWFENDGKGNFKTHLLGENQAAYDIRAVDIDGDKDLDILVAGQASKNVVWYENPTK